MLASEYIKEENSEKKTGKGMIGLEWETTSQVVSLSGKIIKKRRT